VFPSCTAPVEAVYLYKRSASFTAQPEPLVRPTTACIGAKTEEEAEEPRSPDMTSPIAKETATRALPMHVYNP
jgi:hypothetical protein